MMILGVVALAAAEQAAGGREGREDEDEDEALASEAFHRSVQLLGLLRACSSSHGEDNNNKGALRVWVVTAGAKLVEAGDGPRSCGGQSQQPAAGVAVGPDALGIAGALPLATVATLVDCAGRHPHGRHGQAGNGRDGRCGRSQVPEQLAWRDGRWLVMRLRPSALEAQLSLPTSRPLPRWPRAGAMKGGGGGGWVLVSGGLGGLGLMHASAVAREHGVRRLLLLGEAAL